MLGPALQSKAEEFLVLGYGEECKKHELWSFLTNKKWRKPKEGIRIYELVSDVLSMKIGEDRRIMATVEAFRSPNLLSDLESDELQELLQKKIIKKMSKDELTAIFFYFIIIILAKNEYALLKNKFIGLLTWDVPCSLC